MNQDRVKTLELSIKSTIQNLSNILTNYELPVIVKDLIRNEIHELNGTITTGPIIG